jgi:tetratricopeptide (TPR) repeat protein
MGHYLTIYGYDDREQIFQTMDTFLGPWDSAGRIVSYETVEELWEHFNNTFILVHRPDQADEVEKVLGPEMRDPVIMWQNALLMAQETLELEPENAFAWFNLGTSLTRLGEVTGDLDFFDGAVVAFDRAREIGLPWRMLWYQFKPYVAYLAAGRFDDILTLGLAGPDVEETYLYKGHALFAQGNSNGAAVAYRRALELNPNMTAADEALEMLSSSTP